jgi:hypothetical protein
LEKQETADPFAIPITERAGVNLTNYPVRIQLENIGFTDWASLTPESIYFTDANGNPLYFWIELLDTTNKKSIIWVKIPSLPANSQITIYMYYGGSNPYSTYNDPTKVFILFDDFNTLDTTKWTPIGSPTVVDGALRLTPSNFVMTAQVMPKNIRVRLKEMYASFGTYGPRLAIEIRSNSARDTRYDFANEQGNRNTATGYYNIKKYIAGSVTVIGMGSRISRYSTNTWYIEDCRAYETKLSWLVQDGAETITVTDSDILVDGYVILETWDTGNDVRIDWVAIAPYVDPEPIVGQQPVTPPSRLVSDSLVIETEVTGKYTTSMSFTQYPAEVYVNTPYTYQVKLVSVTEGDKPLPGKIVDFLVDGSPVGTAVTDSDGQATVSITIGTMGKHVVEARFPGDETYEPCSATVEVNATAPPAWYDIVRLVMAVAVFATIAVVLSTFTIALPKPKKKREAGA